MATPPATTISPASASAPCDSDAVQRHCFRNVDDIELSKTTPSVVPTTITTTSGSSSCSGVALVGGSDRSWPASELKRDSLARHHASYAPQRLHSTTVATAAQASLSSQHLLGADRRLGRGYLASIATTSDASGGLGSAARRVMSLPSCGSSSLQSVGRRCLAPDSALKFGCDETRVSLLAASSRSLSSESFACRRNQLAASDDIDVADSDGGRIYIDCNTDGDDELVVAGTRSESPLSASFLVSSSLLLALGSNHSLGNAAAAAATTAAVERFDIGKLRATPTDCDCQNCDLRDAHFHHHDNHHHHRHQNHPQRRQNSDRSRLFAKQYQNEHLINDDDDDDDENNNDNVDDDDDVDDDQDEDEDEDARLAAQLAAIDELLAQSKNKLSYHKPTPCYEAEPFDSFELQVAQQAPLQPTSTTSTSYALSPRRPPPHAQAPVFAHHPLQVAAAAYPVAQNIDTAITSSPLRHHHYKHREPQSNSMQRSGVLNNASSHRTVAFSASSRATKSSTSRQDRHQNEPNASADGRHWTSSSRGAHNSLGVKENKRHKYQQLRTSGQASQVNPKQSFMLSALANNSSTIAVASAATTSSIKNKAPTQPASAAPQPTNFTSVSIAKRQHRHHSQNHGHHSHDRRATATAAATTTSEATETALATTTAPNSNDATTALRLPPPPQLPVPLSLHNGSDVQLGPAQRPQMIVAPTPTSVPPLDAVAAAAAAATVAACGRRGPMRVSHRSHPAWMRISSIVLTPVGMLIVLFIVVSPVFHYMW